MTGFIDPAIARKSQIVNNALTMNKNGVPLPSVVEISESGTCNRVCAFCPRSDPDFPNEMKFVEPALLDKVTRQLAEVDYRGIFLFSGFVEPLVDKNIFDHLKIVRGNLPLAQIDMVTNGDVLDLKRLKRLFSSGLSTLLISVYDGEAEAEDFEVLCQKAGLRNDQYVIRHRYLPPEQDFGITLSNRAGLMGNAEFLIPAVVEPLKKPCYYPHYTFFFDYLGDVLLCPHDWGKKRVVGNLVEQNFMDIWTGPEMSAARDHLVMSDRSFQPCDVCDVKGMLMGREHADAWRTLDEQQS